MYGRIKASVVEHSFKWEGLVLGETASPRLYLMLSIVCTVYTQKD